MKKTLVNPTSMVKPISSYSHAVRIEISDAALIFVTGQIALDKDGNVVAPNDAGKQAEFVFGEIKNILEASRSSLKDVVKANIYVTDMSTFSTVAAVRNRAFAESLPASTFVEVNKLVREGCVVEVEVIAISHK